MSATIFKLPSAPARDDLVNPSPTDSALMPIHMALEWGRDGVVSIVRRMLENADDTLFGMAEACNSNEDRKNLFSSMRLLRKSAPALVGDFEQALHPEKPRAVSFEHVELKLVDDQAIEEDIVVARIVARIEDASKRPLWELAVRLENVTSAERLRESFENLRPAGITKAFRSILSRIKIDPSTKLILFKLFERQLIADSSTVYDGLNLRLESAGISSKALHRRNPSSTLPPGQVERRRQESFVPSRMDATPPVYELPPDLGSILQAHGLFHGLGSSAGMGSSTGVPGAATPPASSSTAGNLQRISLVMQLLNELTKDNAAASEQLPKLLVPLLKVALTDEGFFGDQQHPARALLSTLGTGPQVESDQLDHLLSALEQLSEGRSVPDSVAPLSNENLRRFLTSQRSAGANISARVEEARAAAFQQIRSVGSGRDLPAGMAAFLTQFWLPMISATHLKYGAESEELRRATRILQRLFAECRWLPEMKDASLIDEIVEGLEENLKSIAVPSPLISKARSSLQDGLSSQDSTRRLLDLETLAERKEPTPGEPGPKKSPATRAMVGDEAAWRSAVPVGSWFRVFDRAKNQTQWLSASVFYPQASHVVFSGFDPEVKLAVDRRLFLEDLISGKAEAVDPTEMQRSSIRLLCLEFSRAREAESEKAEA